jgi:hypothetical protein
MKDIQEIIEHTPHNQWFKEEVYRWIFDILGEKGLLSWHIVFVLSEKVLMEYEELTKKNKSWKFHVILLYCLISMNFFNLCIFHCF